MAAADGPYGAFPQNLSNPLGVGYVATAEFTSATTWPQPFPYQSFFSHVLNPSLLLNPVEFYMPPSQSMENQRILHYMQIDGTTDIVFQPSGTDQLNGLSNPLTFEKEKGADLLRIFNYANGWSITRSGETGFPAKLPSKVFASNNGEQDITSDSASVQLVMPANTVEVGDVLRVFLNARVDDQDQDSLEKYEIELFQVGVAAWPVAVDLFPAGLGAITTLVSEITLSLDPNFVPLSLVQISTSTFNFTNPLTPPDQDGYTNRQEFDPTKEAIFNLFLNNVAGETGGGVRIYSYWWKIEKARVY
jgi:hypothetical protein